MAKSRRKPWYLKQKTGPVGFKGQHHATRDFKEPIYIAWRQSVRARDNYKCQMPHCPNGKRSIQVHHICPWSTHPHLRYVTSNGICLCVSCHKSIRGHEAAYAPLFIGIAANNERINPQGPLKLAPRKHNRKRK